MSDKQKQPWWIQIEETFSFLHHITDITNITLENITVIVLSLFLWVCSCLMISVFCIFTGFDPAFALLCFLPGFPVAFWLICFCVLCFCSCFFVLISHRFVLSLKLALVHPHLPATGSFSCYLPTPPMTITLQVPALWQMLKSQMYVCFMYMNATT